jgi:hypothetical protein
MLIGKPELDRQLAGSRIGIAYSNPMRESKPGVVFPASITPDRKTGIGKWNNEELRAVIRQGVGRDSRQHLGIVRRQTIWHQLGRFLRDTFLPVASPV